MGMNEDIKEFGVYIPQNGFLLKTARIKNRNDYNHLLIELHHFVPKSITKNNPEFFGRIKCLQKLIPLPKDVHHSLPNRPDAYTYQGVPKAELLFNRRLWREGYYDQDYATRTRGCLLEHAGENLSRHSGYIGNKQKNCGVAHKEAFKKI